MVSGGTWVFAVRSAYLTSEPSIFLIALCLAISGCSRCSPEKSAPDASTDGAVHFAWLDEAKALREKGDTAGARTLAGAHLESADPVERAFAEGMIARLDLAAGNAEAAFPHFRAAIAGHRSQGRISDAADDSFALAFALHQRSHRYDEARAVLDETAKNEVPFYPEGGARERYYRGILAAETGDHRGALRLLREASLAAERLDMKKLRRNSESAIALEMQEIGRAKDAYAALSKIEQGLGADATPCERAEAANNVGWAALLVGAEARAPLERSLAVTGCKDAYVRAFALTNLAGVELREKHLDAADKLLGDARGAVKEPRGAERLERLELEGHIQLLRGNAAKALATFDEALALARAAVLALPEWSALASRAEALEALGKKDEAASALLAAEKVLDDAALLVPLGEGRGSFIADRGKSARAAVDVLVRLRRTEEAARVARHSRARVLAGVERALRIERLAPAERLKWDEAVGAFNTARGALDTAAADDWKLAADDLSKAVDARKDRERELRGALESAMAVLATKAAPSSDDVGPLGAGDVELVVHPVRTGWTAIARDAAGIVAYAVPAPDASPAELARALFGPVRARIEHAKRVRVRAFGAWRAVDVHALPFGDGPLVAKLPVDYPVGLAARTSTPASDRVVIVGDPTGDLPSAGDEARDVAKAMGAKNVTLLIRDEATSVRVNDAVRGAATFHYAGHGVYAGLEGFESALPLANGGSLTVADVLALAPAPSRVVLSGCDAAKSEGDAEGLGLAQAFVASGAEEVVAPVRPVADTLAAKLATRIHHDRADGTFADALRASVLALRSDDPKADWAAFRVLAR